MLRLAIEVGGPSLQAYMSIAISLIVHIDSPPRRLMRPPFPSELTVSITKKGPTSGTFTLRAHAKLFSSYETYILASLQSDVTMRRGKGGG